jgi:valyl-tRNA synthetase
LKDGAMLQELISSIRDTRNKNQLKPKETIKLAVDTQNPDFYQSIHNILSRQVNAEAITFTQEAIAGSLSLVVQTDKLYIETETSMDSGVQKEQLEKELIYLQGFLLSVEKKLSNERFVQNAKPDVIDNERKKHADAAAKIKAIEESLSLL